MVVHYYHGVNFLTRSLRINYFMKSIDWTNTAKNCKGRESVHESF